VINLRDPAELHWDEKNAVKEAGLDYYNIPLFTQDNSFNPLAIKQISTLVQQHQDDQILVHCSSGNRAAAWLAIYLVTEQNIDQQTAIELAKKAGLTNAAMEAKVKDYFDKLAGQ
jgi:protein tyrosine phosphatase (PTP) superfamily phosphohydrolase (DUF442 family)